MELSVLIPWRAEPGPRQDAFDYILPRWHAAGVEVCIGEDDPGGPFNCARALNRAYKKASCKRMVQFGADNLPPPVHDLQAMYEALEGLPWVPLMVGTAYYSMEDTAQILVGANPDSISTEYTLPFNTGTIGYTRDSYAAVGGSDERFEGWGGEDAALRQSLAGLYGAPPALLFTLRCLWHRTDHRIWEGTNNQRLMDEYLPLTEPSVTQRYLNARGTFL